MERKPNPNRFFGIATEYHVFNDHDVVSVPSVKSAQMDLEPNVTLRNNASGVDLRARTSLLMLRE